MLALTSQFIWLLSLWPLLAVGSKRLHDRNKNGWWLLVFWLLPFALVVGGFSIALLDDPRTGRSGDFSTDLILVLASLPPACGASSNSAFCQPPRGRTCTAPTRRNSGLEIRYESCASLLVRFEYPLVDLPNAGLSVLVFRLTAIIGPAEQAAPADSGSAGGGGFTSACAAGDGATGAGRLSHFRE